MMDLSLTTFNLLMLIGAVPWVYHAMILVFFAIAVVSIYFNIRIRRRKQFITNLLKEEGPLAKVNLLSTLINSVPDFIYIKDTESRFILANKSVATQLGIENPDELTGKTDHDFFPKKLADEYRRNEIQIMTSGQELLNKIEPYFNKIKKESKWISTSKVPLFDENNKPIGIVGIGRDITEQKAREELLATRSDELKQVNALLEERQEEIAQQQEELRVQTEMVMREKNYLRVLIDSMPDRIYIKDRDSRFIAANKGVAGIMGTTPEDLIGKSDHDFYPKDLADEYYIDEQRQMESGEPLINKEERGLNLKGKEIIVSTTKVPFRDITGKVIGIVGIGRDITLQKNVEKELIRKSESLQEANAMLSEKQEEIKQQSEELKAQTENLQMLNKVLEKLSIVASKTDNVVVIMDADANFEWVNAGFEKQYGMNLTEFIQRKGKNLRQTSSNENIEEILHTVVQKKTPVIYNALTTDSQGKQFWAQTTISPVMDEGGIITHIIAIDTDITNLKKAQEEINKQKTEIELQRDELRTLNATKDKFFSIIAHDLKNPFHSIIGFSDLLSRSYDSIPDDRKKDFVKLIKDSATSAYSLLENLLNWARSQTNRIKFEPIEFDLQKSIEENLSMISVAAENKKISLVYDHMGPLMVKADINMISTVIRNLISNSLKFTAEGGKIVIETLALDKAAKVNISDTGVGMTEEQISKLFRFDQFHSTAGTDGESGTGLGLIVCKDFVERHGSKLELISKPGKGTTFSFTLPLSS